MRAHWRDILTLLDELKTITLSWAEKSTTGPTVTPSLGGSSGLHFQECMFGYFRGKFNTLWPRQNGRHFADIFTCISLNGNFWISNKISLKYVPRDLIDNKLALAQIMAWCPRGAEPLSEPMMPWFTDAFMRHPAQWVEAAIKWSPLRRRCLKIIFLVRRLFYFYSSFIEICSQGFHLIESTKTTSMEDVSTGVLEKIKNI